MEYLPVRGELLTSLLFSAVRLLLHQICLNKGRIKRVCCDLFFGRVRAQKLFQAFPIRYPLHHVRIPVRRAIIIVIPSGAELPFDPAQPSKRKLHSLTAMKSHDHSVQNRVHHFRRLAPRYATPLKLGDQDARPRRLGHSLPSTCSARATVYEADPRHSVLKDTDRIGGLDTLPESFASGGTEQTSRRRPGDSDPDPLT